MANPKTMQRAKAQYALRAFALDNGWIGPDKPWVAKIKPLIEKTEIALGIGGVPLGTRKGERAIRAGLAIIERFPEDPRFKRMVAVAARAKRKRERAAAPKSAKAAAPNQSRQDPARVRTIAEGHAFYETAEWKKLRYRTIKRHGGQCQACGASPKTGAVLNCDHIKPLRYHWHLRLDPENIQVLCGDCNHGKGNWDDTDWRPAEPKAIRG